MSTRLEDNVPILPRILVCGGRDVAICPWYIYILEFYFQPLTTMISGAARGADTMAANWGRRVGLTVLEFPADWDRYGRRAGPIRNQQMLDEGKPDFVLAFPGGRGTADMVRRAKQAGIPVIQVPEE